MAMNNSLAEVHPELITEWSEKNLPLTPDDITFGSNKKVWWKGTCGHEWQTSVKARSNGEKCPICSGARVIAGINDLATLEPLLAKQWSKKNKIKPTEVSIGSHKKVMLLTLVDSRTNLAKSTVEALRANFGNQIRMYRTQIPIAVKAAETSSKGKSIYAYEPNSTVSKAYAEFTKEVLADGRKKERLHSHEAR